MRRLFIVSTLTLLLAASVVAQQTRHVTVIAESANLRGTPSTSGVVIDRVRQGDVFNLIEQRGAWFLVETPKYTGWLHGNTLRLGLLSKSAPAVVANKPWRLCKLPDMDVFGTCPEDVVPSFLSSREDKGYDTAIVGENKVRNPLLWTKPEARDSSLCVVLVGQDPAICREGEIESLYANDVLVVQDRRRVNNFLSVRNLRTGNTGWVYVGHLKGIYYTKNQAKSIQTVAAPAVKTTRPNSGTVMASGSYRTGLGELTISNGTPTDAIAKLIDLSARASYREVYVQANSSTTISNIAVGRYELLFSLGRDYAPSLNKFVTGASYSKFESVITFEEVKERSGNTITTNYDSYRLTLNKVVGGNAPTSQISEAEFTKY